jgi:hypothetical protein
MAKQQRELLFVKNTGALIGEMTPEMDRSIFNLEKFETKVVEIDTDLGEYWHGDYVTGEIRSRIDKPIITESLVRYTTNVDILTEYPIHKQLNVLIDLLAQTDIPKTPEFEAMREFLQASRQNYAEKVQLYSSNTDAYVWVSKEQEELHIRAKQQFE